MTFALFKPLLTLYKVIINIPDRIKLSQEKIDKFGAQRGTKIWTDNLICTAEDEHFYNYKTYGSLSKILLHRLKVEWVLDNKNTKLYKQ